MGTERACTNWYCRIRSTSNANDVCQDAIGDNDGYLSSSVPVTTATPVGVLSFFSILELPQVGLYRFQREGWRVYCTATDSIVPREDGRSVT